MTIEMLRNALLWCSAINYGLLIVWFLFFVLPHEWMYRLYRKRFRLTAEQFDAINFGGIVLYKLGIILFNLVPYVALRLLG